MSLSRGSRESGGGGGQEGLKSHYLCLLLTLSAHSCGGPLRPISNAKIITTKWYKLLFSIFLNLGIPLPMHSPPTYCPFSPGLLPFCLSWLKSDCCV